MPTIEEIIAAQRKKLVAGENGVVTRIAGAYNAAAKTATARLEATASGLTKQRISILLSGIEDELTKAAGKTVPLIKELQAAVQIQAGPDLEALLKHFELGVRLDPLANERMFAALSPESPLSQLLAKANQAGLTAARTALFTGVALGDNPLKIAPKLREALDVPRWRAQTIARTEVLRTYRGSVRARMGQIEGLEYWRWISARDRRTCAACWAMHGSIHPLDEAMGTHPNCRCSQAPVARFDVLDFPQGKDEFAKLSPGAQLEILGSAKFKAYNAHAITLQDLVGLRNDPRWGAVRYERSLSSVLGTSGQGFYKGGKLPSAFEKQMLQQHEAQLAAAAQAAQQKLVTMAAAHQAAKAAIAAAQELAALKAAQAAETAAAAKAKASTAAKAGAVTKAINKLAAAQAAMIEAQVSGDPQGTVKAAKALASANKLAAKYGLPTKSLMQLLDEVDAKKMEQKAAPPAPTAASLKAMPLSTVLKLIDEAQVAYLKNPSAANSEALYALTNAAKAAGINYPSLTVKQQAAAKAAQDIETMTTAQLDAALLKAGVAQGTIDNWGADLKKVYLKEASKIVTINAPPAKPPTPQVSKPTEPIPAGNLAEPSGVYNFPTRGGYVSFAERDAASGYQDGQYHAWNRYWRETAKGLTPSWTPTANAAKQMSDLDALLTRSRVTDSTLYRRVNTSISDLRGWGLGEGKGWAEHGYMSTSGSNISSFGTTQYVITIPPGVSPKGYLMPTMGSENERLLARGSNFHVDRIDEANAKIYMTYLGVLGE